MVYHNLINWRPPTPPLLFTHTHNVSFFFFFEDLGVPLLVLYYHSREKKEGFNCSVKKNSSFIPCDGDYPIYRYLYFLFCRGEIAVIFEDVKLLKERIDGHLPISRSLSSSQSSTSSSLSLKKASSDYVIKQTESFDNLIAPSEEQLSEGDPSENTKNNQGQTASLDDEWVLFFKNETECSAWLRVRWMKFCSVYISVKRL